MGRRGRLVLGLVALCAVMMPSAAADPYLQAGVNAARSGITGDPGPETYDTAFRLNVPGRLAGTPLIFGGYAFVATFASPWNDDPAAADMTTSGIWRIDLATATASLLVRLDPANIRVSGLASDGHLLFTNVGHDFRAYNATSGALVWSHPHGVLTATPPLETICRDAAVDNGHVFASCYQRSDDEGLPEHARLDGAAKPARNFAVSLRAQDGKLVWRWVQDVGEEQGGLVGQQDASAESWTWAGRIAVIQGQPYVVTLSPTRSFVDATKASAETVATVWALDAQTGNLRWKWSPNPIFEPPNNGAVPFHDLQITGNSETIVVGEVRLNLLDPETGRMRPGPDLRDAVSTDSQVIDDTAKVRPVLGMPVAMREDKVFAGSRYFLHAVDRALLTKLWSVPVAQRSDPNLDERSTLLHAGSRLFVNAHPNYGQPSAIVAVVSAQGSTAKQLAFHERGIFDGPSPETVAGERYLTTGDFAIGDDVLVYATNDGAVSVIGRTDASIGIGAAASPNYPQVDEPVRIDASTTKPGALGPATQYRVSWGDEAGSDWQSSPVFEHAYVRDGEYVAIVHARNPAGQTASMSIPVSVGGEPPPAPSLLASLTTAEARPFTFGGLGFLMLIALGFVVITKRRASVPPSNAELYRATLQRALTPEGTVNPENEPILSTLRGELGLTMRDHTLILAALAGLRNLGPSELAPGTAVLGKYQVLSILGRGGQGITYLAKDTSLDRDIVLKILRGPREIQTTLIRESRALAALRHPNVVTIHDVDRVGDQVFIVMEHMSGGSLKEKLSSEPLDLAEFAALANDLLAGLAAVHAAHLLHLDVKPANILLDSEARAKLGDFGIARRSDLGQTIAARETQASPSGTVAYMAPEQARGQAVSPRTDLFAAGLVLYEAWTGRPYRERKPGESDFDLQMRVAVGRTFTEKIVGPAALRAWFAKALAPNAADRFAAAETMHASLADATRVAIAPRSPS